MCGIAGYYSEEKIDFSIINKMTDAVKHRGPNSAGYFRSEKVSLGHRRLSIIDLSDEANQPMTSASGQYIIVFNGEVYNFKELKEKYNLATKSSGDTEVILELFSKIGSSFVNGLNGMFSIVIYDRIEDNLFLFRDRVGKKPLFYCTIDNVFYFSSEIKSFYAIGLKSKLNIRSQSVVEFLNLGYIPQPNTIFSEVMKFPSGSWGMYDGKNLKIESYWKLIDKIRSKKTTSEALAKKELSNLIHSSVSYRLISDVPFGTFLSGGIDSSLVTAVSSNISKSKINTFSIGFKEAKFDESKFATEISTYLGTNHHQFMVRESDAMELVDSIIDVYDEPFADSSALPTMLVSKLAKQYVTMTLSGDGGDELFLGYGSYNWANRLSNPLVNAIHKPIASLLRLGNNRMKRAAGVFNYRNKESVPQHIFSQEQYLFSELELKSILNFHPDKNDINLGIKLSESNFSPKEQQSFFDFNYYLKDDLLVKVDRASMKYSLETRCPLLDYRLVEFAYNLDEGLRCKNGIQKYILKEVLYDFIPKKYFDRPKMGFSIPLGKWLKGDLSFLFEKYLSKNAVEEGNILNYEQVSILKNRFFKGEDYLYNRLWVLIILQKFLLKANEI